MQEIIRSVYCPYGYLVWISNLKYSIFFFITILQNVSVIDHRAASPSSTTVTAFFECPGSEVDNDMITASLPTFTGFQVAITSVSGGEEVEAKVG